MRIATWNIGEDERNEDGQVNIESYKEIVNQIEKEKIDVICFQEAITSPKEKGIIEYIKNNTKLKHIFKYELSESHINKNCKMGIAICSKYEINDIEKFLFDNPNIVYKPNNTTTYYSHDKGFLLCKIRKVYDNNRTLFTISCI